MRWLLFRLRLEINRLAPNYELSKYLSFKASKHSPNSEFLKGNSP